MVCVKLYLTVVNIISENRFINDQYRYNKILLLMQPILTKSSESYLKDAQIYYVIRVTAAVHSYCDGSQAYVVHNFSCTQNTFAYSVTETAGQMYQL